MTTAGERDSPLMQCTSTLPPFCCTSSAGGAAQEGSKGWGAGVARQRAEGGSACVACAGRRDAGCFATVLVAARPSQTGVLSNSSAKQRHTRVPRCAQRTQHAPRKATHSSSGGGLALTVW